MADLSELTDSVAGVDTAVDSAVALINGLADKIDELSTDPAALADLSASLRASTTELSEAVAANTPEAPPVEEPPVEEPPVEEPPVEEQPNPAPDEVTPQDELIPQDGE
jgi:outer membrane biosynthesis protein TonB